MLKPSLCLGVYASAFSIVRRSFHLSPCFFFFGSAMFCTEREGGLKEQGCGS